MYHSLYVTMVLYGCVCYYDLYLYVTMVCVLPWFVCYHIMYCVIMVCMLLWFVCYHGLYVTMVYMLLWFVCYYILYVTMVLYVTALECDEREAEMRRLLRDELPDDNYYVLKYIIRFLTEVSVEAHIIST